MKFDPDAQPNIHELTIEEPEKESAVIFDVEQEFTDDDWVNIKVILLQDLETNKESAVSRSIDLRHAASMKILGHEFVLPPETWTETEKHLKELSPENATGDWRTFASYASSLKLLGKEMNLTEKEIDGIWDCFERHQETLDIDSYLDLAVELNILGVPVKLSSEGEMDLRNNLAYHRRDKDAWVPQIAANHKILIGDVKLSDDEWKTIKDQLHETDFLMHKVELATFMTILAADEVKIPKGGGLELITHKKTDLQVETPQMPEQKDF